MHEKRFGVESPEYLSARDWDLWFRARVDARRELAEAVGAAIARDRQRRTLVGRLRYWLTGSYW